LSKRKKLLYKKYSKLSPIEEKIFTAEAELDYHTYGIVTSFEIEKYLSEFLEDSYISSFRHVLIITGKGKVIRPLVEKLLSQNRYVSSFKKAGYFTGQEGAFEVILKTSI
jgi:DNA-nicking Smr family endonuclease